MLKLQVIIVYIAVYPAAFIDTALVFYVFAFHHKK